MDRLLILGRRSDEAHVALQRRIHGRSGQHLQSVVLASCDPVDGDHDVGSVSGESRESNAGRQQHQGNQRLESSK